MTFCDFLLQLEATLWMKKEIAVSFYLMSHSAISVKTAIKWGQIKDFAAKNLCDWESLIQSVNNVKIHQTNSEWHINILCEITTMLYQGYLYEAGEAQQVRMCARDVCYWRLSAQISGIPKNAAGPLKCPQNQIGVSKIFVPVTHVMDIKIKKQ